MRASSEVFVTFQKPDTVFGLPPRLLGLAASMSVMVFAVLSGLGQSAVGFIALILLTVTSISFLWRRNRADPHYESFLLVVPRFWRGRSVRRIIAGAPEHHRFAGKGKR